jgi:hypothetical protein
MGIGYILLMLSLTMAAVTAGGRAWEYVRRLPDTR